MRILIGTCNYPPDIGGIAAHVHYLSRMLVKHGHEVVVAHLSGRPGKTSTTFSNGIEEHRLHAVFSLGPLRFSFRRVFFTSYVRRLVAKRRFDLVHIHGEGWEAQATKRLRGSIPVVATMHSSGFLKKAQNKSGRRQIAKSLGHVNAITAPSREICDVVCSIGLPVGCDYIPNGVAVDVFHPHIDGSTLARELGIEAGRRVVVCARRIVRKNGVVFFARAMGQIARQHPDVTAVFAGTEDAEYGKDVRAAVREGGVEGACLFVGAVPNHRVPELMGLSQVSVLPSLVEATSITGLESMASGLPVVGTRIGGIPELIEDGVHGLLVPHADPNALGGAVCRLLSDPDLAARLGAAARRRAIAEFSWERIASRMEAVYVKTVSAVEKERT